MIQKLKKLVKFYKLVECFIPDRVLFQQKLDDFEKNAISQIKNHMKKENNLENTQSQNSNINFSPVSSKNQTQQKNKIIINSSDLKFKDYNNTSNSSKILIEKDIVKIPDSNDFIMANKISSYNDSDSEEYKINSSDSEFQNPNTKSPNKYRRKTKRPEPLYSEERKQENKKQKTEKEIKEYFATREEMEQIMVSSNNFLTVTLTCEEDKNWRMFENLVSVI
jgi:hypothetical protein